MDSVIISWMAWLAETGFGEKLVMSIRRWLGISRRDHTSYFGLNHNVPLLLGGSFLAVYLLRAPLFFSLSLFGIRSWPGGVRGLVGVGIWGMVLFGCVRLLWVG